jgi:hypothetical protein
MYTVSPDLDLVSNSNLDRCEISDPDFVVVEIPGLDPTKKKVLIRNTGTHTGIELKVIIVH